MFNITAFMLALDGCLSTVIVRAIDDGQAIPCSSMIAIAPRVEVRDSLINGNCRSCTRQPKTSPFKGLHIP